MNRGGSLCPVDDLSGRAGHIETEGERLTAPALPKENGQRGRRLTVESSDMN